MTTSTRQLQAQFLRILPKIEIHARIVFRAVRCAVQKADCIAECIALCWRWFVRLARQGKDGRHFAGTLATLAARAVRSGRRLCGQLRAKDVMSPVAQRRHGFTVQSLAPELATFAIFADPHGQEMQDAFEERLQDNLMTPVPDQVAFRVDWPQFFRSLTTRDQQMAEFLSLGHAAKHASEKFGVSPGRVTQIRQRWHQEWIRFQDDEL